MHTTKLLVDRRFMTLPLCDNNTNTIEMEESVYKSTFTKNDINELTNTLGIFD